MSINIRNAGNNAGIEMKELKANLNIRLPASCLVLIRIANINAINMIKPAIA
jgi:hypothetical protein